MKQISPGVYRLDTGKIVVDQEYIDAYEKGKTEKTVDYVVTYIGIGGHKHKYFKQYKPSIAELFEKRSGKTYTPIYRER